MHLNASQLLGNNMVPFSDYLPGYGIPEDIIRSPTDCGTGCLYDVVADPYETKEVSKEHPDVVAAMAARLQELNKGVFLPDRGTPDPAGCTRWDGFYGPWFDMPPADLTRE